MSLSAKRRRGKASVGTSEGKVKCYLKWWGLRGKGRCRRNMEGEGREINRQREADPWSPRGRNRETAQQPSTSCPGQLPAQNGQGPVLCGRTMAAPQSILMQGKRPSCPAGPTASIKEAPPKCPVSHRPQMWGSEVAHSELLRHL